MIGRLSVLVVRNALAYSFPCITFVFTPTSPGKRRGHCISWVDGPTEDEVRASVPGGVGRYLSFITSVRRKQT